MLNQISSLLNRRERAYSLAILVVGPIVSLLDSLTILLSASLISVVLGEPVHSASKSLFQNYSTSTEVTLALFLLVFALRGFLRAIRVLCEANLRRIISRRFASQIFEQQILRHNRIGHSRDSAEMVRDLDSVPLFLNSFLFSRFVLFEEAVLIIGILAVLATQSTPGALAVLTCGGILLFATVRLSSRALSRAGIDAVQSRAKRLQFSLFAFRSIREIVLYGKQRSAAATFGEHVRKVLDAERRFEIISRNSPIVIETIIVVASVVILWLTSVLLNDGRSALSIGVVLALGSFRAIPGISRFAHALQDMKFTGSQANILLSYLQHQKNKPQNVLNVPHQPLPDLAQSRRLSGDSSQPITLEIRNVSFSYESHVKPIFTNFSYEFSGGKLHVIKGESGRGKSTLLALLMGVAEPQSGEILLSGVPLKESQELRNHQIAFVPQSVAALDYSIAANISLVFDDDSQIDERRIDFAISSAGLGEFVDTLSEGLNTTMGELGSRVSGGQLQRIGLARALYQNPKVLLLDETTSSVDFDTEARILSDLSRLKNEILIVMVSHSNHVAQYADRILVV